MKDWLVNCLCKSHFFLSNCPDQYCLSISRLSNNTQKPLCLVMEQFCDTSGTLKLIIRQFYCLLQFSSMNRGMFCLVKQVLFLLFFCNFLDLSITVIISTMHYTLFLWTTRKMLFLASLFWDVNISFQIKYIY